MSGDDNVGVDFIDDIIDGDAAILNDLIDSEPLSTETILEAWKLYWKLGIIQFLVSTTA